MVGNKVVYKGRSYTYIGDSRVVKGFIYLYSNSGSICVNSSMVRSAI